MPSPLDGRLIREAISKLRLRLLDLTNRNRLLNFKFAESSKKFVRVVDEVPNILFARLSEGGQARKMYLTGLPEPPIDDEEVSEEAAMVREVDVASRSWGRSKINRIDLATWAQACGVNPSFDLPADPVGTRGRHTDSQIQLLLLRGAMDKKLAALREDANLAQQESGVSTLYAAFGFLEWYESDTARTSQFSPLFLLPVGIGRELKDHTYRYFLEGAEGSEPVQNISLRERLKQDFGVALPEIDDEDDPETYLSKVARAVSRQPRWQVKRQVVIGHFSFARLAMYEDLGEQRWTEQPLDQLELLHDLLSGRAEASSDSYADTLDVDDPEIEKLAPVLVTDADSSQFSAIVDAMRGRSFALKGPPGTGKSQTITNLIANLLHAGKRVLFVADKLAALQVVSSRLEGAGLDPFVLELHSAKTQKKQVLASIESRLALRSRPGTADGDETLRQLQLTRSKLTKYVDTLNTEVGSSGLTLHDVYWKEQAARRQAGPEVVAAVTEFEDAVASRLTAHDVSNRQEIVQRFSSAYNESTRLRPISEHELYGIERPGAGANDRDDLRVSLKRWSDDLRRLDSVVTRAETIFKVPLPRSCGLITKMVEHASSMPRLSSHVLIDRLHLCTTFEGVSHLRQVASLIASRQEAFDAATPFWVDPSVLQADAEAVGIELIRCANAAEALGLSSVGLEFLPQSARAHGARMKSAVKTLGLVRTAQNPVEESPALSWRICEVICEAIVFLRGAKSEALTFRHDGLLNRKNGTALLLACAEEVDQIEAGFKAALLLAEMSNDPPEKLRRDASTLKAGNFFSSLFSREYRAARSSSRLIARDRKTKPKDIAEILEGQAALLERRTQFLADPEPRSVAGPHFDGMRTNFRGLAAACSFTQDIVQRYPNLDDACRPARQLLLSAPEPLLQDLLNAVSEESVADLRSILNSVSERQRVPSLDEWLGSQIEKSARVIDDAASLKARGLRGSVTGEQLKRAWTTLQHWIASDERAAEGGVSLADRTLPAKDRIVELNATADYAAAVNAMAISADLKGRLLSRHAEAASTALAQLTALLGQALERQQGSGARLVEKFGLNALQWIGSADLSGVQIAQLVERAERAYSASEDQISDWMLLRHLFEEGQKLGMRPVLQSIWERRFTATQAWQLVQLAYLHRLVRDAETKWPDLPTWTGAKLEGLQRRLRDLDKAHMRESQEKIASALLTRPVPAGVSSGAASEYSEKALLLREAGKQKRHISLRDLLRRAGSATSSLKPCYMMSPASVAQYLPSVPGYFDVVIIDEASQMRPEDAIGAAARGKQLIVVGDPKQLPPSTFFDAVRETDEEVGEAEVDVELESILDLALGSFVPARDLRWHYRSRHQSLIAFSNQEFYDRRLIIFPSPADRVGNLGVSQEFVAEGAYSSSVNIPEAERVVACVSSLIRENPNSSIGVVSLNQPHLEILKEKFDQAFALDDELEEYRARWAGTLEPFFAKNLENVQGDERDIIVISTVYGSEQPGGPVAQRFGPINQKVGHRRLNVLFTRAKERVIVVTSLKPEDVRLGGSSSRGVAALKTYLEYSRSGRLEVGHVTGASVESPFEAEVKELLLDMGFKVECQVGVAGFFIDLAVRHPVRSDHFMIGIECDGASYHSSKSARDRDRLRQEILERLHWNLHRIWSTDWFRSRDKEVRRLKDRLDSLV